MYVIRLHFLCSLTPFAIAIYKVSNNIIYVYHATLDYTTILHKYKYGFN